MGKVRVLGGALPKQVCHFEGGRISLSEDGRRALLPKFRGFATVVESVEKVSEGAGGIQFTAKLGDGSGEFVAMTDAQTYGEMLAALMEAKSPPPLQMRRRRSPARLVLVALAWSFALLFVLAVFWDDSPDGTTTDEPRGDRAAPVDDASFESDLRTLIAAAAGELEGRLFDPSKTRVTAGVAHVYVTEDWAKLNGSSQLFWVETISAKISSMRRGGDSTWVLHGPGGDELGGFDRLRGPFLK